MAVFARTALIVYLILQLANGYLCEVVITNVDDLTPLESFRSMAASFGKHVGKNGLKGFRNIFTYRNMAFSSAR